MNIIQYFVSNNTGLYSPGRHLSTAYSHFFPILLLFGTMPGFRPPFSAITGIIHKGLPRFQGYTHLQSALVSHLPRDSAPGNQGLFPGNQADGRKTRTGPPVPAGLSAFLHLYSSSVNIKKHIHRRSRWLSFRGITPYSSRNASTRKYDPPTA